MTRKAKCTNCGKWYYNHDGLMICLPDTYDDGMCPKCNREIDDQIKNDRGKVDQFSEVTYK